LNYTNMAQYAKQKDIRRQHFNYFKTKIIESQVAVNPKNTIARTVKRGNKSERQSERREAVILYFCFIIAKFIKYPNQKSLKFKSFKFFLFLEFYIILCTVCVISTIQLLFQSLHKTATLLRAVARGLLCYAILVCY